MLLSNWFPRTGRGLLLGIWASNATFGDFIGIKIFKNVTGEEASKHWGYGFFYSAGWVFIMGIINFIFLVEKPSDIGLIVQENGILASNDNEKQEAEVQNSQNENKKIPFLQALKIPGIITFSLSFFCIKLSTTGIYYWFPTYLQSDEKGFTKGQALDMFGYFSTGSFLGNLVMGLGSDFLPFRTVVFEIGIIASTVLIFLFSSLENRQSISLVSFFMGSVLFGSTIVIAAIECDIGNYVKQEYNFLALGTFSGMIDGFASLGSVIS